MAQLLRLGRNGIQTAQHGLCNRPPPGPHARRAVMRNLSNLSYLAEKSHEKGKQTILCGSELSYNFYVASKSGSEVIEAFAELVRPEIEDERIDLPRAALTFARIEYPRLDPAVYLRRIDELGERTRHKM